MHSTGLIPLASDHITPPSVTRSGCSNRPPSAVPVCHHSPVLAVYCRLPLFLKGDKGLFLAPVPPAEFPEVRLEDMFPGLAGSNWEKTIWVSQSCGWRSGDKRHSERGQERRPGTDRRGEEGWSTDAGSLRESVPVSVFVCVYARAVWMWAGISRLVGPAWGCGASLCIGTVPAPSERLPWAAALMEDGVVMERPTPSTPCADTHWHANGVQQRSALLRSPAVAIATTNLNVGKQARRKVVVIAKLK